MKVKPKIVAQVAQEKIDLFPNSRDNDNDYTQAIDILTGQGIHNLVVATIQMAVEDVKSLIKAGVISQGQIAVTKINRKVCDGITIPEVKELLHFFEDKNLSLMLDMGEINIEPKVF